MGLIFNQEACLIKTIYIDEQLKDLKETKKIIDNFDKDVQIKITENTSEVFKIIQSSANPILSAKENLLLTSNKGAFVRECPGTSNYKCCGYKILHIGSFCTMDCSYCILQSYFHPPLLQFFLNHDDMIQELDDKIFNNPRISRIGTGEFTDSLIWEYWTDLPEMLVKKFADQDRACLELKTKTVAIDFLKNIEHNQKTIISWSMNTPGIIKSDERKTSTLDSRLKAASKCASWGYPLAFHFDPLFIYKGWEKDYEFTINEIFRLIPWQSIAYISLGSFRFMPSLKPIIQNRFPDSKIVYGEFILGLDGKMRYYKPLRIDLYKKIVGMIKKHAPEVCLYFCMEDDDVWSKVFGFIPEAQGDSISDMLDKSVQKHCGLTPGPCQE